VADGPQSGVGRSKQPAATQSRDCWAVQYASEEYGSSEACDQEQDQQYRYRRVKGSMAIKNDGNGGIIINKELAWVLGIVIGVVFFVVGNVIILFLSGMEQRLDAYDLRLAPGVGGTTSDHYKWAEQHSFKEHGPLDDKITHIEKNVIKLMTELGIEPIEN